MIALMYWIFVKFDLDNSKSDWLQVTLMPFALIVGGTAFYCLIWALWEYVWICLPIYIAVCIFWYKHDSWRFTRGF